MRELLGDEEATMLEEALLRPSVAGLRVNGLKLAAERFRSISPWALEPVPWCATGFRIDRDARPGLHPFHAAGLYYLQEPSAMAVAEALAPRPGERVLDLAAAPGGKSTHIASLLGDSGLLVANDVHPGRARELSRNLERWGSSRSVITSEEPVRLARQWGANFDAVLLDAPCSGEGMFRKSEEAVSQWSPDLVSSCSARQADLLETAARLVRPGGRLAYSTCTLAPEENEGVVAAFLDTHPRWEPMTTALEGADTAVPAWAGGARRSNEVGRAARLWPHRVEGDGHFVAVLRRPSDEEGTGPPVDTGRERERGTTGPRRAGRRRARDGGDRDAERTAALWSEFASATFATAPFSGHELRLERDGLYAVPPATPLLDGLRTLRPGLWLGTADRGRFVPSHALALALDATACTNRIDLGSDSEELAAYMAGAELERNGPDGWTLVTVEGWPIGWGRRARGIVKNHYPKGLRRGR